MVTHIKLYGEKGNRFEEIKEEFSNQFGYKPSNPEVVGYLMATYDPKRPF